MSEQEIRIKIAEACGKHQYFGVLYPGLHCTVCGDRYEEDKHNVPDYLNDLNAAFTLVEKLRVDGWQPNMINHGGKWFVTFGKSAHQWVKEPNLSLARAICLAFLRAINLYTESPNVETK